MSQKRKEHSSASTKKRARNSLSLEIKLEVLKRIDKGERVVDIQRVMGLPESSIRTIRSNADAIRKSVESCTNLSVARVATSRSDAMEKMEKLLSTWIEHHNQRNAPISMAIIQEKAKSLYAELTQDNENPPTFNASRGWFNRFKARNAFHRLKVTGEVASADNEGADEFRETTFKNIIAEGGYMAKQVFNLDETGLYWKRMPSRTFISIEEKTAPGFKAAKDRCTLLFGGNAFGDCKLKPLMIYQSETPRALKGYDKSKLPVVWKSSKKGWMTGKIFYDYVSQELQEELKRYCEKENIEFKVLILLDNVSSHPSEICEVNESIKVVFLPPNTTSILQPMDQGVISAFKANYLKETLSQLINSCDANDQLSIKEFWKQFNIKMAIEIIDKCWKGLTLHCMNRVWKKLWPQVTVESINNSEEIDGVSQTTKEIVNLTHQVGFTDVDEEDVSALLQEEDDLSNEDLLSMEDENCVEVSEEDEEPECVKVLTGKGMSEAFQMINNALSYFENNDPDETRSGKVKREVEHVIKCYRELYNSKLKSSTQLSIKNFFSQSSVVSNEQETSSSESTENVGHE